MQRQNRLLGISYPAWALIMILLLSSGYFIAWINLSKASIGLDEAMHYAFLITKNYDNGVYPPLFYRAADLFRVSGDSIFVSVLYANLFFMIMLISYFYKFSRLFLEERYSLLAVAILATDYLFDYFSKRFLLDTAVAALFIAFSYHLLKSDTLKSIEHTLMMSLAFAAGINLKPQFLIYASGILFFIGIKFLLKTKRENKKRGLTGHQLRNLFVFIAITLFSASFWYPEHMTTLLAAREGLSLQTREIIPFPHIWGIWSFAFYGVMLLIIDHLFFLPFFAFGAYQLLKKKDYLLVLLFVFYYLAFTFIVEKSARFILPMIPLMILISVYGVKAYYHYAQSKKIMLFKKALPFVIILFLIAQAASTYARNPIENDRWKIHSSLEYILENSGKTKPAVGFIAWDNLYHGSYYTFSGRFSAIIKIPRNPEPDYLIHELKEIYLANRAGNKASISEKAMFLSSFITGHYAKSGWKENDNWLNYRRCIEDGKSHLKTVDYLIAKRWEGCFFNSGHPDHLLRFIPIENTYFNPAMSKCQSDIIDYLLNSNEFIILKENILFDGSKSIIFKRVKSRM